MPELCEFVDIVQLNESREQQAMHRDDMNASVSCFEQIYQYRAQEGCVNMVVAVLRIHAATGAHRRDELADAADAS